jgi:hypothetical protein
VVEEVDPELNRALARELYIQENINVVNTKDKKSPSKVKPGQMNLFNPFEGLVVNQESA